WGVKNESLQSLLLNVPLISGLRFPTKHLAAASLGLSVLAARGVAGAWPSRAAFRIAASALLLAMFCVSLYVWSTDPTSGFEFRPLVEPVIAVTAMAAIVFAVRRSSPIDALAPALVAL